MRTFTRAQHQPPRPAYSNLIRRPTPSGRPHHPVGSIETTFSGSGNDFSTVPVHHRPAGAIQAKLAIARPADEYEREADRVSERVMGMPQPLAQERKRLQPGSVPSRDPQDITAPPIASDVLRSPGQPLDSTTRAFMEPRFGHDFADVRVHTNSSAANSAAALNALAYTLGHHIVFGSGQHIPGSDSGKRLLAHELTHVVQQTGGRPLHGRLARPSSISSAPEGLIARKPAPPPAPDPRKERIAWHAKQLSFVADLLDTGRKLKPSPTKNLRDPDTLFRNTVELLDTGKLTLTVLSPTHHSQDKHFDKRVRFDSQHRRPASKPDYPVDPRASDDGMVTEARTFTGTVLPPPSPPTTQTTPPKVERAQERVDYRSGKPEPAKPKPVPAGTSVQPASPPPFQPGDVYVFTHGIEVEEGPFKNTFVHEAQHVADLNLQLKGANPKLEQYKSEFRAFWIEPPIRRTTMAAPPTPFPEPAGSAANKRLVTIAKDQKCDVCSRPASVTGPVSAATHLKNPRQEEIFHRIMSTYKDQQFDCCYVFDPKFRTEVDKFELPSGLNLLNSVRLLDLNLEVQSLNRSMSVPDVRGGKIAVLLTRLEPLDWVFLNDSKLSAPFWDALKAAAPDFLFRAVSALVGKGMKASVSLPDVNKELPGK